MATVMMAAFAQTAAAQVGIAVDVATPAPSPVVLTASVADDDPIVAYDWATLPSAQRCRAASCTYDEPLSACRAMRLEVTTLRGATASAEAFACVDDDSGAPPRVTIELRAAAEGREVRAVGDPNVVWSRLWVDDRAPDTAGEWVALPEDGDCHAVDAVVADRQGRVGVARRQICADDAPRAWVGVDRLCPPVGTPQTFCVEVDHPLGLDVVTASVADVTVGCAVEVAPGGLVRDVFAGVDERGARVFASVLRCGAGASPRLFFTAISDLDVGGATEVTIEPELFGGTPPFEVTVEGIEVVQVRDVDTAPKIDVLVPVDADTRVHVTLEDAEGLRASATAVLGTEPIVAPAADSAGCRTAPGRLDPSWLLLLLVLVRRRR